MDITIVIVATIILVLIFGIQHSAQQVDAKKYKYIHSGSSRDNSTNTNYNNTISRSTQKPVQFIYSAWNNSTGEKVFLPVPTSYAITSTSLQNHQCTVRSSVNTYQQSQSDSRIYEIYISLHNPAMPLYWCASNIPQPTP